MLKFIATPFLLVSLALVSPVWAKCPPTEAMFSGTHHKANPPERRNVSHGMRVHGKIRSATDCAAIANAKIEYWQAGSDGYYTDRLRAWFIADKDGSYQYETEWPGAPIAHIHYIISADGYQPVTTQWIGDEPVVEVEINFVLNPQ